MLMLICFGASARCASFGLSCAQRMQHSDWEITLLAGTETSLPSRGLMSNLNPALPPSVSGDDQSGYNVPEVKACPQLGDFLSQSEEEVAAVDPSRAAEPVRRLLCDSYMFLYQSASVAVCEESGQPLRQQEGGGCEGDCSQNKAATLTLWFSTSTGERLWDD